MLDSRYLGMSGRSCPSEIDLHDCGGNSRRIRFSPDRGEFAALSLVAANQEAGAGGRSLDEIEPPRRQRQDATEVKVGAEDEEPAPVDLLPAVGAFERGDEHPLRTTMDELGTSVELGRRTLSRACREPPPIR